MARTVADLDEKVQLLVNEMQNEVPMTDRPYRALGEKTGLSEDEVLEAIRDLKQCQILRQISTIFDTRTLGYQSSLVAARAPEGKMDAVAEALNQHPGISHNYARKHAFNLWFTIAVPGDSSLQAHVDILQKQSGAESIRLLPTLHLFKIGMKLDATGGKHAGGEGPAYSEEQRHREKSEITAKDKDYVRALQEDMEVRADPFAPIAERLKTNTGELFAWCKEFQKQGRLRRVAGILNHRKAGFAANGMGVWIVPEARVTEVGGQFAGVSAVTHCYLRPTYSDWPYNIFTMVHSKKINQCDQVIQEMSEKVGIKEYAILYSHKEYKKIRLEYFTGEIARWEKDHGLKPGND
ncbi:MAG: Lrp/AsnC family transcriptional regulator [Planctomycetota bacterium]|nr:Lrp/AsnC family transcriptional regulator [Planctomycetota bacterium]